MPVPKKQSIYIFIIFPFMHGSPYLIVPIFMHYFIALYINTPVGIAGYRLKGFIGFGGQHTATLFKAFIPNSVQYFYIGANGGYNIARVIVRVSTRHYHIIAQWHN